MRKNIIFVGDSFCSAFTKSMLLHEPDQQQAYNDSWLDIVSRHFDLDLFCFGHAGKSWYFSRYMWYMSMNGLPDMLPNTEALIFVHTDSYRFNSCDPDISTSLFLNDKNYDDQNLKTAYKYWRTYMFDGTFQEWAQKAWLSEINEKFCSIPDLKILHFFAFPQTIKIIPHNLGGMIFTTPLIHLSLGEMTGSDDEVLSKGMYHDDRCNHFSTENNRNLAEFAIDSINNYKPAFRPINRDRFNLVNTNSFRWPSPGFGTV